MKNNHKPFIFTLLSVLFFIEPLIKILYFKAVTHFDFQIIFANLQARSSFLEVFDFWLAFPLAGALILKLRRWTYFSFMSVLGYVLYTIMTYEKYTWPYNSETPFFYNYFVASLALAVFVVFLFPQARAPFFDRRMRWWEIKERFNVQLLCKVHVETASYETQILNISETGAFLKKSSGINVGDDIDLEFNCLGQSLRLPIRVVHEIESDNVPGFGVRFRFASFGQRRKMGQVIKLVQRSPLVFDEGMNFKNVA